MVWMRWTALLVAVWLLAGDCLGGPALRENLLKNGDFEALPGDESPIPGWELFTSKQRRMVLTDEVIRSGKLALKASAQQAAGAGMGLMQEMSTVPKARYELSCYVINDRQNPLGGGAWGGLSIEWYDANGLEIGRVVSEPWDERLSKMSWKKYEMDVRAPVTAAKVRFVLNFMDGDKGGRGACYVDDVTVVQK